jgi:hypothetical protein
LVVLDKGFGDLSSNDAKGVATGSLRLLREINAEDIQVLCYFRVYFVAFAGAISNTG